MKRWIEIKLEKPVNLKAGKLYGVNSKGELKELDIIKGTVYAKEISQE